MDKRILVTVIGVSAAIAAVIYANSGSEGSASPAPTTNVKHEQGAPVISPASERNSKGDSVAPRIAPQSVPSDPRLAALAISPDNGLIEFVPGVDGRIVKEIDKDPNSLGFGKPLREYMYVGDKVSALTSYAYFSDHVQVTHTRVSYKTDGSVDQFVESTSYDYDSSKT